MKRTVKSSADLKRLALATGAAVEHSGGKFNTTMDRAQVAKPEPIHQPPPPEQKPDPVPAPAPSVTEQIQVSLDMQPVAEAVNQGNERVAEVIKESLKQLSVSTKSAQPNKWLFTIKRDVRGFIESVEATPVL